MTELLTAAQMRAIEAAATASGEVTGLALMERAGRGVVQSIQTKWHQDFSGKIFTVFCGPGFTGTLGVFAAKAAAARGNLVQLFYCDRPHLIEPIYPRPLTPQFGAPIHSLLRETFYEDMGATRVLNEGFDDRDIVIDAVFGRELRTPIEMYWREILGWVSSYGDGYRLIALDLPSGYDSRSGEFIDFTEAEIKEDGYITNMFVDCYDMTISILGDCAAYHSGTCSENCGVIIPLDVPGMKMRRKN